MKLVFVGASRFGLRCLDLACRLPGIDLVGVVTAPRTFSISYRPEGVTNVLYVDVAQFAEERGLPCAVLQSAMNDPALFEEVRSWKPDGFLVAGWYHMIPKAWRRLAPAYGLHASLLPDYSGGAPLVWAMINGETRTGITLFEMDDGVDTGPILGQAEEPIFEDDTIATLYARIEDRGLALLYDALPRMADGTLKAHPQLAGGRRVMPQRSPQDGVLDWVRDSRYLQRFVRAQTRPYPGAFTWLRGEKMYVWAARGLDKSAAATPGIVIATDEDDRAVVCGQGMLHLQEAEYQGRILRGEELAAFVQPGDRLDLGPAE
ncbi:methionyl-tRNA formyltransferase [Agrobacterium sp. RAC06]|uniref:methionyl-tRNA formyltransferase n=1 Tax=Agrobacterium sp. RAC06 TaxID=1842536 RepID=UPI00083D70C7|nr:methionyl-tRNA formyltransferase [Agrobacterium sp. RAC06]AOG12517.1 formyl transferase family protein [Agrobacterium sp. RAC06]